MNNIYIGQNIKKFRTKNNVTQEKLADYLSVSYQAVSKWERNEAYPDITTLPALARFFNTTTDELLGVDHDMYEVEIKDFLEENNRLHSEGEERKFRELSHSMYQKYPNDFRVIKCYMWDIFYDPDYDYDNHHNLPDWRTIHAEELIPLCEKILADCVDDQIRFSAIDLLIMIYTGLKEYDKALEYANRYPNPMQYEKFGYIFDEKDPEMGQYYYQFNFISTVSSMFAPLGFARYRLNNPKKIIKLYKTAIDFYIGIFEEGNLGNHNWSVARFHDFIAEQHISLGEYDDAITNINIAADYYIAHDATPDGYKYKSLMTDRLTYNKLDVWKCKGSWCDWQIGHYTSEKMFDPLRGDKRFEAVLEKLKG